MVRIAPHFPQSHDLRRVDEMRMVSGIDHVGKHGLQ